MKVTTRRFTDTWKDTHGGRMPSIDDEVAVRSLGIEIVPDPEPEARRPLRVEVSPQGVTMSTVLDADNRVFLTVRNSDPESARETRKALEALVSAYNAAGERKRIVVSARTVSAGPWDINGEWQNTDIGPNTALGMYVRAHASDLGLEIVES